MRISPEVPKGEETHMVRVDGICIEVLADGW